MFTDVDRAARFHVQNIYGTPQITRKRTGQCLRPRRMTLIDLRNVSLNDDDVSHRKGSSGTIKSEGGFTHSHKQAQDSRESLTPPRKSSFSNAMKVKHISPPTQGGGQSQLGSELTRFPKLEEYAHFHYELVEIPSLKLSLCGDDSSIYKHNTEPPNDLRMFLVTVSAEKSWMIRRSVENFATLDKQLHRCIYDRRFSQLEDLKAAQLETKTRAEVQPVIEKYLSRFSELAGKAGGGGMVNCGSVLSWMEMDNRGHRLVATDDSGINTPAIAAAHVIKRYNGQAADEISLQVGDMISVIDMPSAEDTIWWRGKRGFEVGFFPSECVEVIGEKLPSSMATCFPEPLATAAASRKPCESLGEMPPISTTTTTTTTTPTTTTPSTPSSSTPSPSPSRSSTSTSGSSVGTVSLSNPESSPTMIRKHGKLLSFLRTFFSHRPPRNQLKQSGIVKERVFGCDLGEHLLNSGHDVPLLLKSCTDIIEEHGIVHGIYRLSGITSNIQKLRLAFDEDRVPDLTEDCYLQDIHSISSLLKMYFRELPNPLLTYQLYDKFADAVRDDENKLLKIHDVVQQLPPPHYRTTEYLMRHLARVAAFGHETEMHSKNLAIVWAPNLLRSKELEAGGGAAALQGVGIQAVVTECLICYCDIIFTDKLPSFNNVESGKSQKRPRPKSLAISTPTRLLSLEEARERAFIGHLAPKKFIDVGGGPKNLPTKYHTVIDLPGYKKKSQGSSKENKPVSGSKKASSGTTGSGGWKSIFSKPRSGSVKKNRKPSQESVNLVAPGKALTEEDVYNWKRHLRSAKSAESLFSLTNTASSCGSTSSRTSRSNTDTAMGKASVRQDSLPTPTKAHQSSFHLSHKRSLSSDAPAVLRQRQLMQDQGENGGHDESRQSFVRGDSTRKALHRRIPSAPNTPRQGRRSPTKGGETSGSEDNMDISLEDIIYPKCEKLGDVNIDDAINSRLMKVAEKTRSVKSSEELASSPLKRSAKSSPVGQKKAKGSLTSPGLQRGQDRSPYDNDDHDSRMRQFYSRFHDYAEILSDDDAGLAGTPLSQGTMSVSSSGCNMQEVLDQIDTRLAMNAMLFPRHGIGDTSNYRVGDETKFSKETDFSTQTTTTTTSSSLKETEFSVNLPTPTTPSKETEFPATGNSSPREMASVKELLGLGEQEKCLKDNKAAGATAVGRRRVEVSRGSTKIYHSADSNSSKGEGNSTRVVRRHAEFIPSSGATSRDIENLQDLLHILEGTDQKLPPTPSKSQSDRRADYMQGTKSSSHHSQMNSSSPHHQSPQSRNSPRTQSPLSNNSPRHQSPLSSNSPSFDSKLCILEEKATLRSGMSKCLSVPSDIARSLENVTESQSDMMSSVTISELSTSINSFSNGLMEEGGRLKVEDPRRRRSTSLDSLTETDHLMSRTLREINRQMDVAFKHDPGLTGSHRLVASDLDLTTSSSDVRLTSQSFAESSSSVKIREDQFSMDDCAMTPTQANVELLLVVAAPSVDPSHSSPEVQTPPKTARKLKSSNLSSAELSESFINYNSLTTSSSTTSSIYLRTQEDCSPSHSSPDPRDTVNQPQSNLTGPHLVQTHFGLDSADGRCDIANMCRNRSDSSSSNSSNNSEEFDEVASPEEDEVAFPDEDVFTQNMESIPPSSLSPQYSSSNFYMREQRNLGSLSVDLPLEDISPYQVVRRQHSPRVEQQSPRGELAGRVSEDNLFLDGSQMDERMSSLCAVGLMSQRARLSRESSNSSLQSPDSSLGAMRSPIREALPDVVQSTTQPPDNEVVNVPLQLALYHPDEFSMDIPAAISGHPVNIHPSPSLPQVHTTTDIVMESKKILKKSSTENCIADQASGFSDGRDLMTGSLRQSSQGQSEVLVNDEVVSMRPLRPPRRSEEARRTFNYEDVAMEVDNLCNKLVVDLNSPNFLTENNLLAPKNSEYGEACQRSSSNVNSQDVLCEVENVLNQGKEILMSPDVRDGLDTRSSTSDSLTPTGSDTGTPIRKTSFSKIPRPKPNSDTKPSGRSSSMHGDLTPTAKAAHARRGSEASGAGGGKRLGHNRRSSDTKITDFQTSSTTTRTQLSNSRSEAVASSRSATSPRSRVADTKPSSDSKSSRIPLSHRVPSPQSEASGLGVSKSQSKIPSPIPKPRKVSCSPHGAPPVDDVIEITRQSVKRENSTKAEKASSNTKKTLIVKDMPDKPGAKLVIESQPELKKKIQTVNSKKVNQPPRQLAEPVQHEDNSDSVFDNSDTMSDRLPGDSRLRFSQVVENHSYPEVRQELVEKKTPPPVAKRKFHYDSKSLPRRSKFDDPHMTFCKQENNCAQYSDMVGSRSSLDDSVLQLAAERHDLFIPEEEGDERMYVLCTGSLRIKRSHKMQSLMDLFERGSDSNVSDSSGSPGTRHRDRTYSGSLLGQAGQLTPCLEVGKPDQESADDSFLPSSPSKSTHSPQTPKPYDMSDVNVKETEISSSQPQAKPGPVLRTCSQDRARPAVAKRKSSPAGKEKLQSSTHSEPVALRGSRPPRYRSNSKPRTYSESSTSESDTSHQTEATVRFAATSSKESSAPQQPSQPIVTRRRTDKKKDIDPIKTQDGKETRKSMSSVSFVSPVSNNSTTPPTSPRKSERRNSIKELRLVFEPPEGETPPSDSPTMSPDPSEPRRMNRMRLSLEIPYSSGGQSIAGPSSSNASQVSQSIAGPSSSNASLVGQSIAGPSSSNASQVGQSIAGPSSSNASQVGQSIAGPSSSNASQVGQSIAGPSSSNASQVGQSIVGPSSSSTGPVYQNLLGLTGEDQILSGNVGGGQISSGTSGQNSTGSSASSQPLRLGPKPFYGTQK
ncbi:uncharacterized protein LOC131956003 isoform X2 [Physella acuta]|uniref:uncharacterized protein LOC131956003 isoform X2 n=1 Tax=Physella acuta TaxID=109671 RepID=UPI0027DD7D17|nr:uncharacterized protein LOC131956003 isoform X2 [Physella acuta]